MYMRMYIHACIKATHVLIHISIMLKLITDLYVYISFLILFYCFTTSYFYSLNFIL